MVAPINSVEHAEVPAGMDIGDTHILDEELACGIAEGTHDTDEPRAPISC